MINIPVLKLCIYFSLKIIIILIKIIQIKESQKQK